MVRDSSGQETILVIPVVEERSKSRAIIVLGILDMEGRGCIYVTLTLVEMGFV